MTAYFLDVIQGILTIKILGNTSLHVEKLKRLSNKFNQRTMGVLKIAFLSALVLEMAATISVAVIAVEIGLRLLYEKMVFSEALFILIIAPEFYNQLRLLGTRFHAGMEGLSTANQIFKFLQSEQSNFKNKSASVLITPVQTISFKSVGFTYPDAVHPALSNISFELSGGSKTALIGKSGSGKSTTINLLLRFIKPQSGIIEIDGKDLWDITENDWIGQLSWLPQKPYIFHNTIFENIRLAKKDATEAEVINSAQKAHLDEFIQTLPEKYNTIVGEQGARLSAGQKQRLALARTFLKNAPILILDEPGANLDWKLEKQIQDDLKVWTKDKTVLTIAHNRAAIQNADQIIQLENGMLLKNHEIKNYN
jgi:ATP-binding cassette subfamily C protein CydD